MKKILEPITALKAKFDGLSDDEEGAAGMEYILLIGVVLGIAAVIGLISFAIQKIGKGSADCLDTYNFKGTSQNTKVCE